MKTTKTSFRLAAITLFAATASIVAIACSGDDNNSNPAPTGDGGMGTDSTMSGDDSSMASDSTSTDSTAPTDSPSLDTGSCKSDGGTCNSCYTAAQAAADPYNACNAYTSKCIPFDPSRVPTHPTL